MYHDRSAGKGPVVGRPEVLRARPDLEGIWRQADALFPVRVTRSFWERMDPTDPSDPLALQVLPDARELTAHPGDLDDPVGDAACSPVPWVVHKYPNRVLWLITKRCHLYCRYCFRRDHDPSGREDPTPEEWDAAVAYIAGAGVQELILSGGDPLAVRDGRLFAALDAVPGVPVRRIHTRAPITRPDRVTAELVSGLRQRAPVVVVVHCNHPRELSPSVDAALGRLVDAGIPVLNQSVLLKGVNDDVSTLVRLCDALVERRVIPYYLHHTDAARGNAHLRVSLEEGRRLIPELNQRVSGLARPRYVRDPPDGTGKIDAG